MKQKIVSIGEILWDIYPKHKTLGGAPANFAYHCAQFGYDSCVVSAIGNDALGLQIAQQLHRKGVKHMLAITQHPTGTVMVKLDANGIPEYDICENVAWDNIEFTADIKMLTAETTVLYFGSLAQRNSVSRNSIAAFIEHLPPSTIIVFDINLRQNYYNKAIIQQSLQHCNILKINEDEILILAQILNYDLNDESEMLTKLMQHYNIPTLILTKGGNGSYVFSNEGKCFYASPQIKVVDTVGAGDSYTAAFVCALLSGQTHAEAQKTATHTAAYVCTQKGAMPAIKHSI